MLHPSTQKLIDRLAEMTDTGRLSWGAGEDGAVVYSTEGYSVTVTDGAHELVIHSHEGAELERASHEDLTATVQADGTYSDTLATLHRQATRIAKGTEKAITSLLAGIDTAEPVAAEPETDVEPGDETAVEDSVNETDPTTLEAPEPQAPVELETEEATSEPDMAAAVAKMADEVNAQQADTQEVQEGALTAAAAGLAATVGLVEGEEATETEPEFISEPVEAAFDYVPFGVGLPLPDPAISSAWPDLPAPILEPEPAPQLEEPAAQDSATEDTFRVAPVAPALLDEPLVEPAPVETPAPDMPVDPVVAFEPVIEPEEPVLIDPVEDTALETSSSELTEVENEDESNVVAFTSTFASPMFEEDSDTSAESAEEAPETPVETASEETSPAEEEAPQETSAPDSPQSYSLSGIGAGFGLGALKATTEASGIPSASEPEDSVIVPEEKIVIDATDDLPPLEPQEPAEPVRTADPLPDLASLDVPEPPKSADETEENPQTGETDGVFKPRTRFNPWT